MDERVLRILLESVKLTATETLRYGSIIQLTPELSATGTTTSCCLSITPSAFKGSRNVDTINEQSAVTLAESKYPCRRNTFQLVHPEGGGEECREIKYNEDFLLQSCCPRYASDNSPHLVIYSSNRILDNPPFCGTQGNPQQQPVALTEMPPLRGTVNPRDSFPLVASLSCRWRFVYPDPEYRYEFEGQPICPSSPVLLLHSATNKFLTPDWHRQRLTLLGSETCLSVRHRSARSTEGLGMWVVRNRE